MGLVIIDYKILQILVIYIFGSWNNGNINAFIGIYDYDNGAPLDKNLWTI